MVADDHIIGMVAKEHKLVRLPQNVVDWIADFRDDNRSGSIQMNFHSGALQTCDVSIHEKTAS